MPDFPVMAPPAFDFPSGGLLDIILQTSLSGVMLLRPLYDEAGDTIIDLGWVYLNSAAQQMLRLPERPTESFSTLFPTAAEAGVFGFYRDAFLSGKVERRQNNYQHDGLDGYYLLVAQRYQDLLVVSFTDTNDQPRTAVEEALRESQAREQQARATTERERALLQALLAQAPVAIGLFQGEELRVTAANSLMAAIWGYMPEQVLGRPLLEGVPELQGQGFDDLLRQVLTTRKPVVGTETPALMRRNGKLKTTYYNFVYQPLYDAAGEVLGVTDVAVDVTEQVEARYQVQELNEELAAINEELRATNEEYLASNTALGETQQQLRQLNAELEARVQERTQQLADQQAMLQQIQSKVPAYLVTFSGPKHVYTYFNEAYGHDLAQGRAELGRTLVDCFPELIEQGFIAVLDEVYATGQPFTLLEAPVVMHDPLTQQVRTLYVNVSYHLLRTEAGETQGIMAFATDVTEQVLAQRERDAQRQQLQALFAQAPVAVCVLRGEDFMLDVVNPPMAEMLGHPLAALVDQPVFDVLPELRSQELPALLAEVRRTGTPFVAQEREVQLARHRPGESGYFNFVYQPLLAAAGHVTGIVIVATDVTEQVWVRQQVQDLNQELASINEELTATNEELHESNTHLTRTNVDLDTFVYTASHDLKAPITNIEGILAALRETLPPSVQQDEVVTHLLGLLDTTVSRFLTTIHQLTDLTRLQQRYEEPAELLALAPMVADVLADLAPVVAAAEAQVHVAIPAELHISFAPASLRSIFYNLLSNAVKYRDPQRPAQVWLRVEPQPGAVVLSVQDNGLGLTETQQKRLFGVFQRLHTHVEGTGVGLYMIKRLIENGGARINVTSAQGVGSTFSVTFPA